MNKKSTIPILAGCTSIELLRNKIYDRSSVGADPCVCPNSRQPQGGAPTMGPLPYYATTLICMIFLLSLYSCDYESEESVDVLMRTPVLTLSISEFLEELELRKVSYPYSITNNSAEYNDIIIELVNTLSEEMVLLSAALTQGIEVSQEELETKAEELKKEYHEDEFAKLLLEKAIPLELWQERLRKNIIIEKLIRHKIKEKVEISPEEIVEFYKNYNKELSRDIKEKEARNKDNKKRNKQGSDNREDIKKRKELKDEQELIVLLRLQKTRKLYEKWIKELEQKFPVEINKEKLKSLFST